MFLPIQAYGFVGVRVSAFFPGSFLLLANSSKPLGVLSVFNWKTRIVHEDQEKKSPERAQNGPTKAGKGLSRGEVLEIPRTTLRAPQRQPFTNRLRESSSPPQLGSVAKQQISRKHS